MRLQSIDDLDVATPPQRGTLAMRGRSGVIYRAERGFTGIDTFALAVLVRRRRAWAWQPSGFGSASGEPPHVPEKWMPFFHKDMRKKKIYVRIRSSLYPAAFLRATLRKYLDSE